MEKILVGKMSSAIMVTVFLVILFRDISCEVTRYNKKAGCKIASYWPICRRTLGTFQVEDMAFQYQTGHYKNDNTQAFPKHSIKIDSFYMKVVNYHPHMYQTIPQTCILRAGF